jgi:multidrug efflux pump subunit AcrB
VPIAAALIVALGVVMLIETGRDFFPAIDGGQIKLHVRAPAGTRIDATEVVFQAVEDKHKSEFFRAGYAELLD